MSGTRRCVNKLKRVASRWKNIGAAMAFSQWAGLASEKKRKEQLMIRFAGRLANMEVARAWASWVDMCDSKDKMRGALMGIAQPMLRKTWLGWVRFHQMHNESKLKKAGRFAWGIEHAVASFIWGIEQTAEHVFHLDRRARRATANARRRALMGIGGEDSESEDGDDDIPHRMKTRMRSRRIEPMYSDYDPGIYGLRPGDGPLEHRRVLRADGGYLSEHGHITQPIADAQQDATAIPPSAAVRAAPARRATVLCAAASSLSRAGYERWAMMERVPLASVMGRSSGRAACGAEIRQGGGRRE